MEDHTNTTTLYLDMDGVLCDFSNQYRKFLSNDMVFKSLLNSKGATSSNKLSKLGLSKKQWDSKVTQIRNDVLSKDGDIYAEFKDRTKNEALTSLAWKVIAISGVDFWSTMEWQSGGQELVKFVKSLNLPVEILTAGSGASAASGKQAWLKSNGLGDLPFNIVSSGKEKYKYASSDKLLIDDMDENIELFRNAGGMGIIHTDTNKTISQVKELL